MLAAEGAFDALGPTRCAGAVEHGVAGALVGNGRCCVFAHRGCVIVEASDITTHDKLMRATRDQRDQGFGLRQRRGGKNDATGGVSRQCRRSVR